MLKFLLKRQDTEVLETKIDIYEHKFKNSWRR